MSFRRGGVFGWAVIAGFLHKGNGQKTNAGVIYLSKGLPVILEAERDARTRVNARVNIEVAESLEDLERATTRDGGKTWAKSG